MNDTAGTFGAELVQEIGALPEVFGLRLVLWVGLIFAITLVARALVTWGARLAWRIGFDPQRRLGRVAALLRGIIWTVGVVAMVRPVFARIPVLTALTVGLFALLVAIALPGLVQSLAAGLSLALRARFREGDQIEVGDHRGSIRQLGLIRTQLRVENGSAMWIPNAMLDREAVKVERATGAAPVRVRFNIDPRERDRVLDAVTRAVTTLPFRRTGSLVRLEAATDDEREWIVELQTWATRELDVVRRSVRRTVDRVLSPGGTP